VSAKDFAESFNICLDWLALRAHIGPLYPFADSFEFRRRIDICHNFVDYFVGKALAYPLNPGEPTKGPYVFIRELTRETRDPRVIRDQAFNLLLAGRDTNASLLSFIIYYLARHKDVWQKLRAAVLHEFSQKSETLTFETLKRCTYLTYVINEVLRLHPTVPLNFRTAIRDTILPRGGGPDESEPIVVPKGTKVVYTVYTTQRLVEYWGDDAEDFRPERWAESKLHTWDYLPFNGGPRICIGQQFALTEVSYCVVRICQTFKDLSTTDPTDYHDIRQWAKLTSSVVGGVPVNFVCA
jgi:cytochrome P450